MMSFPNIHQLIQSRKLKEADAEILAGLKVEPDSADLLYLRGILRSHQGKLTQSIDDLKQALKHDPKHTDAAVCLSVILNDIGKYDDAKSIFEQANQSVFVKQLGDDQQIDRRFSVKHFELGDLYFRYRRFDEAIDEYNKAIILDPTTIPIHIRRAKAFAKKGFVTRAIQELQQLKAQHPSELTILIQLGLLHYSQGNILDAGIEWETVLEHEPTHREANSYLDLIRSQQKIQPQQTPSSGQLNRSR